MSPQLRVCCRFSFVSWAISEIGPSYAHIHPLSERRVRHLHSTCGFLLIGLAIHIALDVALLTILDNLLDLLCMLYLKTVFIK